MDCQKSQKSQVIIHPSYEALLNCISKKKSEIKQGNDVKKDFHEENKAFTDGLAFSGTHDDVCKNSIMGSVQNEPPSALAYLADYLEIDSGFPGLIECTSTRNDLSNEILLINNMRLDGSYLDEVKKAFLEDRGCDEKILTKNVPIISTKKVPELVCTLVKLGKLTWSIEPSYAIDVIYSKSESTKCAEERLIANLKSNDVVLVLNPEKACDNKSKDEITAKYLARFIKTKGKLCVFCVDDMDKFHKMYDSTSLGPYITDPEVIEPDVVVESDLENNDNVITWQSIIDRRIYIDGKDYMLPNIVFRSGLFTVLNRQQRELLKDENGYDCLFYKTFTFKGKTIRISGPVLSVDTDLTIMLESMKLFMANINVEGIVDSSLSHFARIKNNSDKKVSRNMINSVWDSLIRLRQITIIDDANMEIFGLIDRVEKIGKGRASILRIRLSSKIAERLIDSGFLSFPTKLVHELNSYELSMHNYLKSIEKYYPTKIDTWIETFLGLGPLIKKEKKELSSDKFKKSRNDRILKFKKALEALKSKGYIKNYLIVNDVVNIEII